jgi:lambda family phage portal protein
MFGWLKRIRAFARPAGGGLRMAVRFIRGRYDAAQTTDSNRKHWAGADGLSADAAASAEVRRILRNRARYEVANNSYVRGIVLTLANDVVGTGPRLQMLTAGAEANRAIEQEFMRWATRVGLAAKLRTMRMARAQDGEAFALLISNENLNSPVTLDLRLIEADQVATPDFSQTTFTDPSAVDGISFDPFGNPVAYYILKTHPGAKVSLGLDYDRVPAEWLIHWFRADRPGQHRGIPDLTPALPIFAQLRRFTSAVLDAAETAANISGTVETDAPPNGEAEPIDPMDTIELERNMLLTLPGGWKMSQVKPEQPATTYVEFVREKLNEAARCLNMPRNIALCDSSAYNYASGRLDHQTYFKSIRVEQAHLEDMVLDRVLDAWLREAVRVPGLLPASARALLGYPHQWFWDGMEHVDPAKEANAQATRLASHTTTLASEYAKEGKDWETELRQRAKEVALMKELGLPMAEVQPKAPAPQTEDEEDRGNQREAA